MEFHLSQERVAPFRRYLKREKTESGALAFEKCPFLEDRGCTVHEVRPMSCRLYGHFRSQSQTLFEHCVFRGRETVFADHQEHLLTPGQPELTELNLEYLSYFPPEGEASQDWTPFEPQTPLELASELKYQGQFAQARDLLQQLREQGENANLLLMLAQCHEALGEYNDALNVLTTAISRSPHNPELHTLRGANHLWLGQLREAEGAFLQSIALAPDRRNVQGLLGLVYQLQGALLPAKQHLARAVELEKEPGPYRFTLASVLRDLGELPESTAMFEQALEFGPTREAAEQALSSLP